MCADLLRRVRAVASEEWWKERDEDPRDEPEAFEAGMTALHTACNDCENNLTARLKEAER